MRNWFHRVVPRFTGRNLASTPASVIIGQMNEPRPLPMGRQEFDDWADRLIAGALVPADPVSQKFALASMIMHLGPTEDHKPDAFFIHSLRKGAVNQVAHAVFIEMKERQKAEAEAAQFKVVGDAKLQ